MFPAFAFAHAVPTSYTPVHGAMLAHSPQEVTVTFTDRVDPASAALILHAASGTPIRLASHVASDDPRALLALLPSLSGGATIMWGVTSLDDGHYTRGAFNFSVVGEGSIATIPAETISETHLAIFLIILAVLLIFLRVVSLLFLEKQSRCLTCIRSYTLLEALMGSAVLCISVLLLFVSPVPRWKMETKDDGITTMLHMTQGSALMHLTVQSPEELPLPLFEINNREASIDPMPIALTLVEKNEEGTTYSFPSSVFVPYGNWHVSTTFVRGNHYDAHGAMTFVFPGDVFTMMENSEAHSRCAWSALALATLALLLVVWRVMRVMTRKDTETEATTRARVFMAYGTALLACMMLLFASGILAYALATFM